MRTLILACVASGSLFGGGRAHAQETAAQKTTETAAQETPAGERGVAPAEPAAPAAQPNPVQESPELFQRLRPEIFGYMKVGYFFVTPPREDTEIGSNSGFRLLNARVGVSVQPAQTISAVVTLEASAGLRNVADPLTGSRFIALRDAFLEWRPSRFFRMRAGQFKIPFNAESLFPDATLPFITRSVVTDGIFPPEGYPRAGIALDRQLGVQISSERIGSAVAFQYAIAVVNGNGPNALNNDNNDVAPAGRFILAFGEYVQLGVNGLYNTVSLGDGPRVNERHLSYGGDIGVTVGGLNVFGMYVTRNTTRPGTGLPADQANGWVAQVHYNLEVFGVDAGVRYATLAPSRTLAGDRMTEATAMLGYRPGRTPLRLLAQYTLRMEEPGAAIPNDSVDVLAQVSF